MAKSHVSLEQHQCPICHTLHDTGSLLLHTRMRPTLEMRTTTGRSACPACKAKLDEGYIAIVECNEATRKPTGHHAFLKRETWGHIFTMPTPPHGICMAPPEVLETLRKMAEGATVAEAFTEVAAASATQH